MFGLYLHIPFCQKKCSYCDFYSIESTEHIEAFVKTLLCELELRITQLDSLGLLATPVTSIFFGGGTPSLLTPMQIEMIMSKIRQHFKIDEQAEITMECNPGTVTPKSLSGYRALGINRLSFGVQSFTQSELEFLDRIHSADEANQAMFMARQAGFTNVNMDLMFAVPGQTMESLAYNLKCMLSLEPDHISAYSLIYEHGTPLYARLKKGLVTPTKEEVDAEMYALVINTFTSNGYHQYEVSNFAKPGRRCIHNLTYWHGNNYIAVGPSAHGFLENQRYWNHRSLTAWTSKVLEGTLPVANFEELSSKELLGELAFLTLRADGLPVEQFKKDFGVDLRLALQPNLGFWIDEEFIVDTGEMLALTSEGYRVCDEITVKVSHALDKYNATADLGQ